MGVVTIKGPYTMNLNLKGDISLFLTVIYTLAKVWKECILFHDPVIQGGLLKC